MKPTAARISLWVFAIVAVLLGLFYLFADFGKALSVQCALLLLVGTAVLCVCIFLSKPRLCGVIILAISLSQLVAIYSWVAMYWVQPWFFGRQLDMGPLPLILHIAFAICGGFLSVKTLSHAKESHKAV